MKYGSGVSLFPHYSEKRAAQGERESRCAYVRQRHHEDKSGESKEGVQGIEQRHVEQQLSPQRDKHGREGFS